MPIIITVSHAICYSLEERDCDRRAMAVARILHEILLAKKCDVVLDVSGSYRPEIDSNRIEARDTVWRRRLRKIIREQQKLGRTFVLDVHSFPPDVPWLGHLKAYFIESEFKNVGTDQIYRSWSDNDRAWTWLAVKESLGEINAKIVPGDGHNDIMITSAIAGASSVILEVNESHEILSDVELRNFMVHLTDELFMKYC